MPNEPTTPVEAEGLRLLTDAELDAVSGGADSVPCVKLTALALAHPQASGLIIAMGNVCGGTG